MASQTPVDPDSVQRQDQLIHALADARRRRVVRSLQGSGDIALDELARRVARSEPATTDDDQSDHIERVRVDLYHCQLPVLAAADLVTFDREQQVVAITDGGTERASTLDDVDWLAR